MTSDEKSTRPGVVDLTGYVAGDPRAEAEFAELLACADEIVLPSPVSVPRQRARGAWYDVTRDAVAQTDGMSGYGS